MKKMIKSTTKMLTAAALISALMASTVFAASENTIQPTISVSGNGLLKVAPDIAYLNVGVRTSDTDAEAASKENTEITERIVESILSLGIDKKDMKTQNYNVYPSYDYGVSGRESKITGYEVTNSLNITIRKIDDVGKIIDECIKAGANMMNGLSYGVETPSAYYGQLFQKAVNDAGKKASAIASALGVTISAPVSITEGGYINAAPIYMNVAMDMRAEAGGAAKQMASTYTAPGEIDLSASVGVVYLMSAD